MNCPKCNKKTDFYDEELGCEYCTPTLSLEIAPHRKESMYRTYNIVISILTLVIWMVYIWYPAVWIKPILGFCIGWTSSTLLFKEIL